MVYLRGTLQFRHYPMLVAGRFRSSCSNVSPLIPVLGLDFPAPHFCEKEVMSPAFREATDLWTSRLVYEGSWSFKVGSKPFLTSQAKISISVAQILPQIPRLQPLSYIFMLLWGPETCLICIIWKQGALSLTIHSSLVFVIHLIFTLCWLLCHLSFMFISSFLQLVKLPG